MQMSRLFAEFAQNFNLYSNTTGFSKIIVTATMMKITNGSSNIPLKLCQFQWERNLQK
jgi:hypothetical protein